jgi:hypothetical protein
VDENELANRVLGLCLGGLLLIRMQNIPPRERLKDVLISIFVGACVSFLTTLFSGILHFLQGIDPATAGGTVAMAKYLWTRV